jgi:hypothetical protein
MPCMDQGEPPRPEAMAKRQERLDTGVELRTLPFSKQNGQQGGETKRAPCLLVHVVAKYP